MSIHAAEPQLLRSRAAALKEVDRLKGEVESLRGRLAKLNEAALVIAGSLDVNTVLQAVIDASRLLTGARYGAILTFDDSGETDSFITSGMSSEEQRRIGKLPKALGILAYLNEVDGPLRLADIASHPKSVGFPKNHPPMKSFLGISMRSEGNHLGNIYLAEKEGGEGFTREDEESLVMFASQAAAAIANSHAYAVENRAKADLEALLEISPVAVMVFDAKTRDLVSFNSEVRRIAYGHHAPGYSLEELMDMMTLRRPNGQDIPPEELPTERSIRSGQTVRAEEIVIHLPDGKMVPVLCSTTPIRKEDGEIVGVIATLQDMTPLEDLVKQRAEFLSMVSSELRNPLASIKGSVATLLGSSSSIDTADTRQFLRIIDQQTDRMSGLLSNLMDMSRLEMGTASLDAKPLNVATLIEDARRAFLTSGARNIVTVDITQPLPPIMADGQRIKQVLINLFSNASRHSPDWSQITVSASVEELQVVISVADEGAGIETEHLSRIFRKYPQFDIEHLDSLGVRDSFRLALCWGIVEAHGGRIWAESGGLGLGATYVFTIPVADEGVVPSETNTERASSGVPEGIGAAHVLVVEDDPQMLRSVHRMVLDAGHAPIVTNDPDEAVHLVKAEDPDLVLVDFTLPGTDGVELMKRILEVSDVPVIFVPDHDSDDLIAQAFEAGAEDYIVKPFSSSELTARIKALLRKRGAIIRTKTANSFVLGELTIDYLEGSVRVGERLVQLTPTEYKLLNEFSANPGRVLTYDHLLRRVWGSDYSGDTQMVRTFVKNLRRKLGDKANNPTYILTVPTIGYRMPLPARNGSQARR